MLRLYPKDPVQLATAAPRLHLMTSARALAESQSHGPSWAAAIARDRSVLRKHPSNTALLATAAPRLVDTVDREKLMRVLRQIPPEQIASHSGLAFAAGYADLVERAVESGTRWLTRAQAALQPDEVLLGARIAFELGAMYVSRNCAVPADVLLLDRERPGAPPNGDLLHLRALSAEAMGDHTQAIALYRQVLSADVDALSPSTRVLAMINLAASCTHRDPSESLALTELAVATIASRELHGRMRPPALNIMGYALISLGRLGEARQTLATAASEAKVQDYERVALYASFNLAIVDELQGDSDAAVARLRETGDHAAERLPELAGWVRIRLAWLAWLTGDVSGAASMLSAAQSSLRSMRYAESLLCLQSLLETSTGSQSKAIAGFESLRRSAALRGDSTTEFALLLRLAHLESARGSENRALRSARRALAILRGSNLRASPNWWSQEIVTSFRRIASDSITDVLVPAVLQNHSGLDDRQAVDLRRDGTATIGAGPIRLQWGAGRTGSRVLRRMFCVLLESHPSSVLRDVLADALWPESEGDAAVRNLYAASNDLRKVLVDLPGVRLKVGEDGYGLRLDDNVDLLPAAPDPARLRSMFSVKA